MLKPIVCLIGCTISAITWFPAGPGWTQTIGDEAELDLLRAKAEDAIAVSYTHLTLPTILLV